MREFATPISCFRDFCTEDTSFRLERSDDDRPGLKSRPLGNTHLDSFRRESEENRRVLASEVRGVRFHDQMDTRRWGPGERIVFEPYTKEVFEESFRWIKERGIFAEGTMGAGRYEEAVVSVAAE